MSKKNRWGKICKVPKNATCFNCTNKSSIIETKNKIIVTCTIVLNGNKITRTIDFNRNSTPNPFCGSHQFDKI